MLKVQEFLRNGGTLAQLANDLGIKVTRHPVDPLIILNYDQIDSPKTNEIVRECRALTLEDHTFNIVGRSFPRFFNWGECADEMPQFNWSNCFSQSKEDGSLMVLYNYNRTWRVNTRGSFADGLCGFSNKTWSELFFEVVPKELVQKHCCESTSYVFEFCSLHNKVVRQYDKPKAYLLTTFYQGLEFSQKTADLVAKQLEVCRPEVYNFSSIDGVIDFLKVKGSEDKTFEGVVICDDKKRRWKVKNPFYLSLHRMRGESDNLFNPKYLLPYVLDGEGDELLAYFPEVKDKFYEMKAVVSSTYASLEEIWEESKGIESQKDFALSVVPRTKFSSILFKARKGDKALKELWRESEDLILKVLFNK